MKAFDHAQGKPQISFADFTKLDLRGGRKLVFVVNLEPKKFTIRTARKDSRTLPLSDEDGLRAYNEQEYVSQGMLMAADGFASAESSGETRAILYSFDKDVASGTTIR